MVDWHTVGPRAVLLVVLLGANVALVGAMSSSSTPYGPYNGEWDGTSDLRQTSGVDTRVAISTSVYETVDATEATAFVLAPQRAYGPIATARVRQFVRRGGTLVVATESTATNDWLAALGGSARVDEGLVRDEQSNYRSPALPVATNVSAHPLVEGVDQLTLNYARTIRPNGSTVLVRTAPTAYLDRDDDGAFDANESVGSYPVATVDRLGAGRLVLVSDASVFTNALATREGTRAFVDTLAGSGETVILDNSHAAPLPPLSYAQVVLRTTPLAQFGLVVGVFGLFGGIVLGGPRRLARWLDSIRRDDGPTRVVDLSEEEIARSLSVAHPEWDDDRRRRVTKAIIRRRAESGDDD